MEKKYLKQFVDFFDQLMVAGTLSNPDWNIFNEFVLAQFGNHELEEALLKIDMTEEQSEIFMFNLFAEIELNFYTHSEHNIIFTKDIIRQFKDISTYLCHNTQLLDDGKIADGAKKATRSIINNANEEFIGDIDFDSKPTTEKYIIICSGYFNHFFVALDALCLDFGIDIMDIQKQLNIYPYKKRNTLKLIEMGYEEILKTLDKNNSLKKSEIFINSISSYNPDLMGLKHQFDIAIRKLHLHFPLIIKMFAPKMMENKNYELFIESIKTFNDQYSLYLLSNTSIEKVLTDAKLFLNNDLLERFYHFCKNEILILQDTLQLIKKKNFHYINNNEKEIIQDIFFENFNFGLSDYPRINIAHNINFPEDLFDGIKGNFDYFEKKIDELDSFSISDKANKILIPISENDNLKEDIVQKQPLMLKDVFADDSKYECIMGLLVNEGYCQSGTYIWKDFKSRYKGLIASILKYLHFQNYYKEKTGISNDQIREIALNTFRVPIEIDTIKKAKPSKFNLDFIPESSTLINAQNT